MRRMNRYKVCHEDAVCLTRKSGAGMLSENCSISPKIAMSLFIYESQKLSGFLHYANEWKFLNAEFYELYLNGI